MTHKHVIHQFCRESSANVIPVQGVAPSASETPLNATKKGRNETNRGDHWIEKRSPRTKQKYISADVGYWKTKLHEGLKLPIGTSESISLYHADSDKHHYMAADHCNSETVVWTTATKSNDVTSGCWKWTSQPSKDNHIFDNFVGCLMLLSFTGCGFAGVMPKQKRKRGKLSDLQKEKWKQQGRI